MPNRHIQINILPQDPFAWLCIAAAVAIGSIAFSDPDKSVIEREHTKQIQLLIDNGKDEALTELIKQKFNIVESNP